MLPQEGNEVLVAPVRRRRAKHSTVQITEREGWHDF